MWASPSKKNSSENLEPKQHRKVRERFFGGEGEKMTYRGKRDSREMKEQRREMGERTKKEKEIVASKHNFLRRKASGLGGQVFFGIFRNSSRPYGFSKVFSS